MEQKINEIMHVMNSIEYGFRDENNKNINNGLLFQNYNNTNTYRKYYSCPGYGWQEMIAPE